jgi:ABC-type multidrug transport system permease subunit
LKFIISLIYFLAFSASALFVVGFVIVGVDCFQHGDIGPYPLVAWADRWLLPVSMLCGFVANEIRKGGDK